MVAGKKGYRSDINITPLVDVVLVLLIIFMVLTPLAEKEFMVRVPETQEVEVVDAPPVDQYVVSVKADGKVFLNREEVLKADLRERIKRAFRGKRSAEKIVFFDAEDKASYADAVAVLDIVRGAGVGTIGMMTERPQAAPELPPGAPGELPPVPPVPPVAPVPPVPPVPPTPPTPPSPP
jgi:biopolymer transport protein ExbD/biopolymer transport protein TolR